MKIIQGALSIHIVIPPNWHSDWEWGLSLILLTVVLHVLALGYLRQRTSLAISRMMERRHPTLVFVVVMGTVTLLATCLHGLEAGIWAAAYQLIGALPNSRSAMLFSLNAMTSYGQTDLRLEDNWRLMGAIESLNGWLLFGMTTAFLFSMIQKVWILDSGTAASGR